MRIAQIALLACLAAGSAWAEGRNVYVIASEPYDDSFFGFPTLLYRVEAGKLVKVRTITTQGQSTRFVDVYPRRGYALIGSDRGGGRGALLLDVIDMETASAQISHEIDLCENECAYISSHMQRGGGPPVYVFLGYSDDSHYSGLDLKTGRTLSGFGWHDIAGAYRIGSGSPFADGSRPMRAVIHEGVRLIYGRGDSPLRQPLDWKGPSGYGWEPKSTLTSMLVNNDDMRLISVVRHSLWEGELRGLGLHVYDKAAQSWSKLDLPEGYGRFRAFGRWLASMEAPKYAPGSLNLARLELQEFPPFLSAAVNLSQAREIAPTGRLLLCDARAKALIIHDTGEPNSEVLYVDEDDVAWYRVSDELRRARIEDGRLGPEELMAKGPELWAAHWLFYGRE